MEKEIPFPKILDKALYEYEYSEGFDTQNIPTRLLYPFIEKLFENTKLAGDKGSQYEILDKMFASITVIDQYNLGIIDDTFLVDYYRDNEGFEDLTSIREQYNK